MGRTGTAIRTAVETFGSPRLRQSLLPLFLIAGLAACGAPRQSGTEPAPEPAAAPAGTGTDTRRQMAAPVQPVLPPPDSKRMMGLNRNDLASLLGSPTLRRADTPAEVWQYRDNACVLHVFLYQDPVSGGYAVTYVDTVQRGARLLSNDDCFGVILRADSPPRDS